MEKPKCNVAIVGCGLGGVTAAIAIRRAGHYVTVHEQAEGLSEIGAGIQLPYNCTRILHQWNILSLAESQAVRPSNVVLRTYRDGSVLCKRQLPTLHENGSDIPHLLVHRSDLLKILVDEAVRLGISLHFGSSVTKIDFVKPSLFLMGSGEHMYDVIFGADGAKSFCRGLLFGNSYGPQLSSDVAYRITIPVSEMEKVTELAPLIQNFDISCWMRPQSHVIGYQLRQGSVFNVVLVGPYHFLDSAHVAELDMQEMKARLVNWDPQLQKLVQLSKGVLKRRLQGSHEMAFWRHPGGSFALVGDACHASLPHLAQGVTQAFEDGAVLGALFARLERKSQIKDIIDIYEKVRKPRTSKVIAGSDARRDVYQLPDGEAQRKRDQELTQVQSFDGYPSCIKDPDFQTWLLNYDTEIAVQRAWDQYQAAASQYEDCARCVAKTEALDEIVAV